MMLEVRCCCTPDKLLGYLPEPMPGQSATVFSVSSPVDWTRPSLDNSLPEFIRLEVHQIVYEWMDDAKKIRSKTQLAYKAEGVPVETLERIHVFLRARR